MTSSHTMTVIDLYYINASYIHLYEVTAFRMHKLCIDGKLYTYCCRQLILICHCNWPERIKLVLKLMPSIAQIILKKIEHCSLTFGYVRNSLVTIKTLFNILHTCTKKSVINSIWKSHQSFSSTDWVIYYMQWKTMEYTTCQLICLICETVCT